MSAALASTRYGESGYRRMPGDFYATPEWVTKALIRSEVGAHLAQHLVWEPAAGNGDMARVLQRYCREVTSTDIELYTWPLDGRVDFTEFGPADDPPNGCTAIITNPPYSLADGFLSSALSNMKIRAAAMLLPNDFMCAEKRKWLREHPMFRFKIELTSRIRWVNLPKGSASPRNHHAWFVFCRDHGWRGHPQLSWAGRG